MERKINLNFEYRENQLIFECFIYKLYFYFIRN